MFHKGSLSATIGTWFLALSVFFGVIAYYSSAKQSASLAGGLTGMTALGSGILVGSLDEIGSKFNQGVDADEPTSKVRN